MAGSNISSGEKGDPLRHNFHGAVANSTRLHGSVERAARDLEHEAGELQRRIDQQSVLPAGHPGRQNIEALEAQAAALNAEAATLRSEHQAAFDIARQPILDALAELEALQLQLARVNKSLKAINTMPVKHPLYNDVPALEAERTSLQSQIDAVVIPELSFP